MPHIGMSRISGANSDSPNVSRTRYKTSEQQGMFACQNWHKLYAEALIESDLAILASRIRLAEHAMFLRYLEVRNAREPEEFLDLRRAVAVLTQLIPAHEPRHGTQRFVAPAAG
jgi:hypothetical protein